jgi:hypothetical protein
VCGAVGHRRGGQWVCERCRRGEQRLVSMGGAVSKGGLVRAGFCLKVTVRGGSHPRCGSGQLSNGSSRWEVGPTEEKWRNGLKRRVWAGLMQAERIGRVVACRGMAGREL